MIVRPFENGAEARALLKAVERLWDPGTLRILDSFGIKAGWNCLEVGAGCGSVAQALASLVAPTGRVIATDLDTRFLEEERIPDVEIQRHDILHDPVEANTFDVVHARLLLVHLDEPERALDNMIAALKPGGWLLIEDTVRGSLLDAAPPLPELGELREALGVVMRRAGFDPASGVKHVPRLVARSLTNVRAEGRVAVIGGGSADADWHRLTVRRLRRDLVESGMVTEAQLARVEELMSDPDVTWLSQTMVAAWGQRPVVEEPG